MTQLPPVDLHAHVETSIAASDLRRLEAVVFVATRSLDETEAALRRNDDQTVWGVGCHPGLVGAQKSFSRTRFAELIEKTAFVSEVGLDGSSRVPLTTQQDTLGAVLAELRSSPRLTSLHSYNATGDAIAALESQPIKGAVLHWWLGTPGETERALLLGCHFSVNASSVRRGGLLDQIPLNRILTETDHPFGDRRNGGNARPGNVGDVELALGARHGLAQDEVRTVIWNNLARLVSETGCASKLPRRIRVQMLSV